MSYWHLLFPLLSSVLFVIAGTFAREATLRGTSPFTITAFANLCLASCWVVIGLARGEALPLEAWWPALWIATAFVAGQLCTFLAFHLGDVSLATPVFGVKIILVAVFSSLAADHAIEPRIWMAAVLATVGIGVIQLGSGSGPGKELTLRRAAISIALAIAAATALSLFDIGLQLHGRAWGAERFLTLMFLITGVLTFGLLPWCDGPAQLRRIKAGRFLLLAALIMALQAISISYSLGQFGDATRINIVYSLRGLWSVALAWLLMRLSAGSAAHLSRRTLAWRLLGAILLTIAVVVALW
jgi:drug/metabolite transporter (DMT)-like permease